MSANSELADRRSRAIPLGVSHATDIYADRARNAEVWDADGRRYIDFAGGIAVLAVGHNHPKVIAAVADQMERFVHTAFQVMPYGPYVELAERLNAIAPFSAPAKTLLFTTGGEAVENAVKIARHATGRSGVIAFAGAFHGRSLLGMALTGKVEPYKSGFGTMPGEVYHIPFPNEAEDVSVADTLRALGWLFKADIDPKRVAAIIIEPVQGEGGFNVAPPALMQALRATCDAHGIVLIVDEVQTGFGRTGKMFAVEHSGVEPDLVAVAKSLGGGLPIAGVIGRADVMDKVGPGGIGSTYAGAPLACAAALAVLDVLDQEKLVSRADVIGRRLVQGLEGLARRNGVQPISSPRGLGAMVAVDVLRQASGAETDPAAARRITRRAAELGLIVINCGPGGQAIRILVPLTISDETLDEGLAILAEAMGVEPAGA